MKFSSLCVTFILAVSLSGPVSANVKPTKSEYTLDQFYHAALTQAEQINIARESVAIAQYTRSQAISILMPRLSAFGAYTYYNEEKQFYNSTIQPQWDSSYGLRVGQSVTLNGRELAAYDIAKKGVEKSGFDLEAAKEGYLFGVASSFFQVAKTTQAVLIAEASVTRLTAHKNAVNARMKLGEVSKTELFRTEAELASANADLIQYKNICKLTQASLARLTGLQLPFDIKEPHISKAQLETTRLEELKQIALTHRAELKSYALDETMAGRQVDYNKGAYWPRLSIEGTWVFMEQDPEPMLDQSASITANLSVDLFDGGLRKSQVSEARSRQKQAELLLHDAKKNIMIEVQEAFLNWQTQQEVIASLESQLRYAKENFEASVRLFEHGMANSVDVMDANTLLSTAQWQLAEARYNLQLAVLGVKRNTGVFLSAIEKRLEE